MICPWRRRRQRGAQREVFRATTEGSIFGSAWPVRVHYFATFQRAEKWGRRYLNERWRGVRIHSHGAVYIQRKARGGRGGQEWARP